VLSLLRRPVVGRGEEEREGDKVDSKATGEVEKVEGRPETVIEFCVLARRDEI